MAEVLGGPWEEEHAAEHGQGEDGEAHDDAADGGAGVAEPAFAADEVAEGGADEEEAEGDGAVAEEAGGALDGLDGPCGGSAWGEEGEPVDEIEEEACDDGADDWVEHFAERAVGGGLHEPDASGPEDEFDAETVDEEDAHPVAAREEDGHDGDGEVAVVLDGAGEGEGAAGGGFAETEDGSCGVGEEATEEHEEDAADEGDPDIFGAAEGGVADDVLEDEAGVGDVDGEADHGGVTGGS